MWWGTVEHYGIPLMSRGARIAGAIALWPGALIVGLDLTSNNDDADEQNAVEAAVGETTTTESVTVVEASLVDGQFSVSGPVPNEATAAAIAESAAIVDRSAFVNNLVVDPSAVAQPWLQGTPQAVTLLPIIGQGTMRGRDPGVAVNGSAPSEAAPATFAGAVEQTLGAAPDLSGVAITNLGFPSFNARRQGDQLVLSGQLANQQLRRTSSGPHEPCTARRPSLTRLR